MEIHFQIRFQKNRFDKNYNDWIFGCDLTKIYHVKSTEVLSKLRMFNVRRGILEMVFPTKFQNCFYKCVVIIASYQ